ncbi:aspartate aminotransferase family protein [Aliifodinibius sp. S!AR15-10]|uniref:aspartate aminotransferase family protein n=1 Tax=Aliifodinibius sp. S!AR15-10 TaxID=2950437 RepID=UPI002862387A|nr:aspartate aminotransferase family protein [Aliifodinibius sp. S!AR15-10]MDR8390423.1 aspartate aminotransferase family protein [Aliifodinibius sp. S!AR15-10]
MTESQIPEITEQYYFNVFNRLPITLERGEGTRVWDEDGNEYIDFLAGIAVNSLGHNHPAVVKAIQEQSERLIHASNIFYYKKQAALIKKMAEVFDMDRIFLCNSGAEAVEGSIKLARRYAAKNGKNGEIITMENGFHGRTIATISMGMKKYQEGFDPMLGGFKEIPFNDIEALEAAFDENTTGVILEIIQGSGGLHVATKEFMKAIEKLCRKHNAAFIVDEVQTGVGRTGAWFSYQNFGVQPDIVASAKALGNGFPIGAVLAREEVAEAMGSGMHGSTFGGNPVASAAALATLEEMEKQQIVKQAAEKGAYFVEKLQELADKLDGAIRDIRGLGLMIGVELSFGCGDIVTEMLDRGIITNCTKGNVIRIVPPIIITAEEIDTYVEKLEESIKAVRAEA